MSNSSSPWLRRIVGWLVLLILGGLLVHYYFPATAAKFMGRGPMRVLVDRDRLFHAGYGEGMSGPDIELIKELALRTGRQIEFVPLDSMPHLVPGMKDLENISVLLDFNKSTAESLGFEVVPGLRQPRPGVLQHPEGKRPDAGPVPLVAIVKVSGNADAVREAIKAQYQIREVETQSEAEQLFGANRKVGIFLYPEVDGIVVSEEEARQRMDYDKKLRFFPITTPTPVVPVAFAGGEKRLRDAYKKMIQAVAGKGEIDRFVRLPAASVEVDKAAGAEGFTLNAAYTLPYKHIRNNSGLTYTKGYLWAAHGHFLFRIPLEAGVPKIEATQSAALTAQKDQYAAGITHDGADGIWVGYNGWPQIQHYAPLSNPKLAATIDLRTHVMQYGMARHQERYHIVGYAGKWMTFDIKNPKGAWKERPVDRTLFGMASYQGQLYAATTSGLVILQEGRIKEVPLHGSIDNMGDFQGIAFNEESGVLYVLTKERLLRYVPGQVQTKVEISTASLPQAAAAPAPPALERIPLSKGLKEIGSIGFPGEPTAMLKMDGYWLGASRITPWGLLKMKLTGTNFITEERFMNKQPVLAMARMNNMVVVACDSADGGANTGPQLMILDPANKFKVIKQVSIPETLGGLAVDNVTGRIWGAGRAHTEDAPERASYYTFDRDLKLLGTVKAEHQGCQGLAWTGKHLLAVDVFRGALYFVDPASNFKVIGGYELPNNYPSGLIIDGGSIYVGDYQTKQVHQFELPKGQ